MNTNGNNENKETVGVKELIQAAIKMQIRINDTSYWNTSTKAKIKELFCINLEFSTMDRAATWKK